MDDKNKISLMDLRTIVLGAQNNTLNSSLSGPTDPGPFSWTWSGFFFKKIIGYDNFKLWEIAYKIKKKIQNQILVTKNRQKLWSGLFLISPLGRCLIFVISMEKLKKYLLNLRN